MTVLVVLFLLFGLSLGLGQDEERIAVLADCYLTPLATAANEIEPGNPTETSVRFILNRIKGVDDLDQTFTAIGTLVIKFHSDCLIQRSINSGLPEHWLFYSNTDDFWKVPVTHDNSAFGFVMHDERVAHAMRVLPYKGKINHFYTGIFESECALTNLRKFPFDTETCWLEFSLLQSQSMIKMEYSQMVMKSAESAIGANAAWQIVDTFADWKVQNVTSEDHPTSFHIVYFGVVLTRRSEYYVHNLIMPCFTLTMVQMVVFLIPFGRDERISFTTAVLLAFAVTRASIIESVPKTAESILLMQIISIDSISSMFFVFYSALCAYLYEWYPELVQTQFKLFPLERIQLKTTLNHLLDFWMFVIFSSILLMSNIALGVEMLR